jgi:MFS family permease
MAHSRKIIYLAGFLFSISFALTAYINSSFLENFINKDYIGLVYAISSILTIWGLFKMSELLSRLGNRRATLCFSAISFISLLLLSFTGNSVLAILAFAVYFISTNFIIATLDIFIEDLSQSTSIGKFRGLYLFFINSAWVVAQMISGSVIAKSSFQGIYLLSAGFMTLVAGIFVIFMRDFQDPIYERISIRKTFKIFLRRKNLRNIYLVNFILKFFFAWMVIYTPIYLHENLGFGWDKIGIIFTIMLLPFVILDYPLGKLSDKMGEKKMITAGFVIITIFTFLIPLIPDGILILWALILFGTRVGAATIEVMSESYFFKEVTAGEADEISFFRNNYPLSYLIAPLLAVPILFLLPSFRYIFFVLSAILLLGLFLSLKLRDIK